MADDRPVDTLIFENKACVPFTGESWRTGPLPGSEMTIVLVAEELARRGRRVVVATNTDRAVTEYGVEYVPWRAAPSTARNLIVHRYAELPVSFHRCTKRILWTSDLPSPKEYADLASEAPRPTVEEGEHFVTPSAYALQAWQKAPFHVSARFATSRAIPNILPQKEIVAALADTSSPLMAQEGRFAYASAGLKGLYDTLHAWRSVVGPGSELHVFHPGYDADTVHRLLRTVEVSQVFPRGAFAFASLVRALHQSEGLFYVNTWPETFGIVPAIAQALGLAIYILVEKQHGMAGLAESLLGGTEGVVVGEFERFREMFLRRKGARAPWTPAQWATFSPQRVGDLWEALLLPQASASVARAPAPEAPRAGFAGGILGETRGGVEHVTGYVDADHRVHLDPNPRQWETVFLDRVGLSHRAIETGGIGGTEHALHALAQHLAAQGQRVLVITPGQPSVRQCKGVKYESVADVDEKRTVRTANLVTLRASARREDAAWFEANRRFLWVHDLYRRDDYVHVVRPTTTLVGVSQWQVRAFEADGGPWKATAVAYPELPALASTIEHRPIRGRFLYASTVIKGLKETLEAWRRSPFAKEGGTLLILNPNPDDVPAAERLSYFANEILLGHKTTVDEVVQTMARCEGLFYVNTWPETYGTTVAIADRIGLSTFVWCRSAQGAAGLAEAVGVDNRARLLVGSPAFWTEKLHTIRRPPPQPEVQSRTSDVHVLERDGDRAHAVWTRLLQGHEARTPRSSPERAPTVTPVVRSDREESECHAFDGQEPPAQPPTSDFFGGPDGFLHALKTARDPGGSELGLGLTLFALAVSVRATWMLEFGRYKGFATMALAAAARFQAEGWNEPTTSRVRRDVDYEVHEKRPQGGVVSIDFYPRDEAKRRLLNTGLWSPIPNPAEFPSYVTLVDGRTSDVDLLRSTGGKRYDLAFVDADHALEAIERDVARALEVLHPGGLLILHDLHGWYEGDQNVSPPLTVATSLARAPGVERLTVDTGYMGFAVLRIEHPERLRAGHEAWAKSSKTWDWTMDEKSSSLDQATPALRFPAGAIVATILSNSQAARIVGAVESALPWVDGILLIDTGIQDGSHIEVQKRAEAAGKPCLCVPYGKSLIENFAAGRQFALEEAHRLGAAWAVTLDTDERLQGDPRPLDPTMDYYLVPESAGAYAKERIIHLPAKGHWHGRTHECYLDGGRRATLPREKVSFTELGKTPLQLRQKCERDLPLLLQMTAETPEDGRWWYYLGDTYDQLGQHDDAIHAFAECALKRGWGEEGAWACYRAAKLHLVHQRLQDAAEVCAAGIGRYPGFPELPALAARTALQQQDWTRAVAWASMATALGCFGSGESVGRSRILFGEPAEQYEGPYATLTQALRALGREEEARVAESQRAKAFELRKLRGLG